MRTQYSFKNALKTCCLLALVALVALVSAVPALAQTTFGPFSAAPAVAIPDDGYNGTLGSMASSAIAVSGVTGTSVINIEVDVNINHTWVGDLTIKLQSPDGDILTLVSRPGLAETADDGTGCCGLNADWLGSTLTFTDLGAADAETMNVPFTGTYYPNPGASAHPTQTFASLFGGTMNGNWTLYAGDAAGGDLGTLNSWAIRITTVTPSLFAFVAVTVATDGDCTDDPLPATPTNLLAVTPGTNVCYFYYGENTGDVALNVHDVSDDVLGPLLTAFTFPLAPGGAAYLSEGPVTINATVTNTGTWTAYNPGPTDIATASASATVFVSPDNNDCADAIALSCGDVVSGSTIAATEDGPAGDCVNPANSSAADVWYTVSGTGYGITASLCGSGYDTKIAVLTGDCGALVCVGGNDDLCGLQSELSWTSTLGEIYYIRVHGFGGQTGAYTLAITCAPDCNGEAGGTAFIDGCGVCVGGNTGVTACPNVCVDAVDVSCGDVITGTTVGATNADAPATCVTSLNTAPGLWYHFVGNGDNVTASLVGSAYDTKIGVFSGACGSLVCVTGNDDFSGLQSQVGFSSVVGTDYYIYVTGFGTASGAFTLALTCVTPPPPACSNAVAIACGDVVTGTTVGATADPAAGTCVTGLTSAPGVYYVVQGTGLDITASLCGSAFDTKIGVFSGTCGTPLTCVTGNDDSCGLQSEVTFTSVEGESYYIYVTGFSTNAGNYQLSVTCDFLDCNGNLNGTAFLDDCNVCVGGNTGLTACVQDCNGDFGGTAVLDDCNVCVGGNTGLTACVQDCNGDFGGTAVLDNCNVCVGGNTGLTACVADCNGDFGGSAFIDDCDDCVGGNTGLIACVPIGVAESGLDRNLSVYPNPNNGQFIVELNGAEGVGTLNIMDMMGRRVYTAGVNFNGSFRQSIDLNVAKGTYVLQVVTENGIATRKVELH